jgi:uncharacterized protein (DUF697 family)
VTEREAQARETVKKYTYWSMGAGLIPIPVVDLAAVAGIQLKMIAALAKQYSLPFSHDTGKALLGSVVGGAGAAAAGPTAVSMAKGLPLIGQAAGAAAMPAVAGASTYAVGKVFIQHFESGGTFLDFDPAKVREHYAREFDARRAGTES